MILFLYGKDTFRSLQQLHKMVDKFKADRDPSGMNVVRLNCEKNEEANHVMEQILSVPFLAERRMVVVENLLVSKQKELREDVLLRMEEKTLPDSTVLVFWEGTDAFKTKDAKEFFARLSVEKFAQAFDELSGAKLEGWIASEVAGRGGAIDRQAVAFLAAHVGSDTWRLSTLFDQLLSFAVARDPSFALHYQGREITIHDVRLFVPETGDDNIFNLVDAIVAKQSKRAYIMIEEQYRRGQESGFIYAMILRQFRVLLEMRDLFERKEGITSDEMARQIGAHPFVVKKTFPVVKRYMMQELRNMYDELLKIDVMTKTGGGDQKMLLDVFVAKVSFYCHPDRASQRVEGSLS